VVYGEDGGALWRCDRDGARARWCGRDGGAVNGEERMTRANTVGASGYASGQLGRWASVMWPINRDVPINGRP
jgi:hypothetical protein